MRTRLIHQRVRLAFAILLLVALGWWALAGAIRQFPVSFTSGQRIETAVQFLAGVLTLLVLLTRFVLTAWTRPVRFAWATSLVVTAGLSALVWGPPMPLIALLSSGVAALVAWVVLLALRTAAAMTSGDVDASSSA
jgi:hypothetical protein